MTHSRMLDRAPGVSITHGRNELKLYQDNTVYLNDGDNFELRFFNPLQQKIGVEIMFNGIKKGDGYLVLNPGQDLVLDRFLDEQRKMLFETYVVDGNNAEAVEAIAKNGLITFNFYKENGYYDRYTNSNVNINYNFPPIPPKPYKFKAPKGKKGKIVNNYYYGTGTSGLSGHSGGSGTSGCAGTSGTGFQGLSGPQDSTGVRGPNGYFTHVSPGVSTWETDNSYIASSTTNINYSQFYDTLSTATSNVTSTVFTTQAPNNTLETGRIEMGDISTQTLKTVNAQFQSIAFHTVSYQILPYSAMNRTINEVRQYCPHCAYRIRKNTWLYCPKCGNSLD